VAGAVSDPEPAIRILLNARPLSLNFVQYIYMIKLLWTILEVGAH
jgi:hypothetical protein